MPTDLKPLDVLEDPYGRLRVVLAVGLPRDAWSKRYQHVLSRDGCRYVQINMVRGQPKSAGKIRECSEGTLRQWGKPAPAWRARSARAAAVEEIRVAKAQGWIGGCDAD